jgi:hypothetical protein
LLRLQLGELFGGDFDGLLLKDVQEPRGLMIPPSEFLTDLPPSKKCGVDHQGNGESRRERISHGEIAQISRFDPVHLSKRMP